MKNPNKKKKSIFKRWWFWVIAVFVFIAVVGESGSKENVVEEIEPLITEEVESEKKLPVVTTVEEEPASEPEQEPEVVIEEPEPKPAPTLAPAPAPAPEPEPKSEPVIKEPTSESEPAPNATSEGKVFGSYNSNKYHNHVCSTWTQKILDAGNDRWFTNEAEAEANGYVPCSKCYGS